MEEPHKTRLVGPSYRIWCENMDFGRLDCVFLSLFATATASAVRVSGLCPAFLRGSSGLKLRKVSVWTEGHFFHPQTGRLNQDGQVKE